MKFWFDKWNNIENIGDGEASAETIKAKSDNIAEKIYKDKFPVWYALRNKINKGKND